MSDTWDDEDRAIAQALDAGIDGGPVDERAVAEYREVLGHLPLEPITPPSDLEDRVVAAALGRRPAGTAALDAARSRRRSRLRVRQASARWRLRPRSSWRC